MQLSRLVKVSRQVAGTRSRLQKIAFLSECLRAAAPEDIKLIVDYLTGALPQGRVGIGPAILRDLAGCEAVADAQLSLQEVDNVLQRIAETRGKGSQQARREQLGMLLSRATASEQDFLIRLILGELRQGALEGVLIEGIADAAGVPAGEVRRAAMLAGATSVADAALREGPAGLSRFRLEPMSPVKPMLAQPAKDMDGAMLALGDAILEYKLDGARVQIHKVNREVRIFSRRLNDVTESLPEIVAAALTLPARSLILDGEVIALRRDGRPHPFQFTMRRFGRKSAVADISKTLPLSVFLFDCLYRDGDVLIDLPTGERWSNLVRAAYPELLVSRTEASDTHTANAFLTKALAEGHEGVMAKSITSPYAAGNRGAEWLKVKQTHTLDLVVLAAEWGSGRRQGWLSNLHLGARDARDGSYVMLGKTFKGLTDKMLEWQTRRLLQLEIGREQHVVHVRPELVVEIAVNEIQSSSQYPAGMALRFARVKHYRRDKRPTDADTIDVVRALYRRQTGVEPAAGG